MELVVPIFVIGHNPKVGPPQISRSKHSDRWSYTNKDGSDGTSIKKMGQEAQDTGTGVTWQICKQLSQVNKIRVRRVGTIS